MVFGSILYICIFARFMLVLLVIVRSESRHALNSQAGMTIIPISYSQRSHFCLQEQGLLNFDDNVQRFIPNFAESGGIKARVTLRSLDHFWSGSMEGTSLCLRERWPFFIGSFCFSFQCRVGKEWISTIHRWLEDIWEPDGRGNEAQLKR